MTKPYFLKRDRVKHNFHPAQKKAWASKARYVAVIAGTQGGKTSFGPLWLRREIKEKGAGDYLVVAPSYPLLSKKVIPEFEKLFEKYFKYGKYNKTEKIFKFSPNGAERCIGKKKPIQVFFGHAQDPDSLESATAKGAWLDECGQKKFRLASYEAIERRLSIHQGRVLFTTTPYYIGWLKKRIYDKQNESEEIEVVNFKSTDNPSFPQAEYDKQKRVLPDWKFKMMYDGKFTKPAGMIYDIFGQPCMVAPFDIPHDWPVYTGIDFGGVNTAAVFVVQNPSTSELFVIDEYKHGNLLARQHADNIHKKAGRSISACFGGAKSEGQWRSEFAAGGERTQQEIEAENRRDDLWASGLNVQQPRIADLWLGINSVYGSLKTGRLKVFGSCKNLIDEFESYSHPLDDNNEPITDKIEDKSKYHYLDALRYIVPSVDSIWGAW